MNTLNQNMDKYVRIGVNRYKVDTLANNWDEERFDSNYIKQLKPVLNDYAYAYESTYADLTSNLQKSTIQQEKANNIKKSSRPIAFPGHQVELAIDDWQPKPMYDSVYMISYVDPKLATGSLTNKLK